MGDLQVFLPQNGVLTEETSLPSPSLSPSNPNPSLIGVDSWQRAEKTTHDIICRIQPTVVSEQRRKAVIDYVQRLIRRFLSSEVFPFGSVPLKTYLPDGDIDLTALSFQNVEDALANDVRSVLEGEEQNKDAEFEVKDVQYIHAEVKLVKCLVQNIVVDISFNQLGGLCTLCFLEQVLYRFLDYFSKFDWDNYGISLNGPIAVSSLPEIVAETPENGGGDLLLDKDFLTNCLETFSIPSRGLENHMRSFPQKHLNIVDPLKENNNLGRSVSKGNLYRIRSAFTFGARKLCRILMLPGKSMEDELDNFFLNTLERHGSGQRPDVQDSFPSYRHSNPFGVSGLVSASSMPYVEKCVENKTVSGLPSIDSHGMMRKSTDDGQGVLCEEISSIKISGSEKKHGTGIQLERHFSKHQSTGSEQSGCEKKHGAGIQLERQFSNQSVGNGPQKCANIGRPATMLSSMEGNVASTSQSAEDAKEFATSCFFGSRITNETPSNELGTISFRRAYHAPHLYVTQPLHENEKFGNGNLDETKLIDSTIPKNTLSSEPQAPDERSDHERKTAGNDAPQLCGKHVDVGASFCSTGSLLVSGLDTYPSETPYHANDSLNCLESSDVGFLDSSCRERDLAGAHGNSAEASNSLSELNGDYDSHINSLQYGRWCHEYILCGPVIPFPPQSPFQYRNKSSWDALRWSTHVKQRMFPHMNTNGVDPGPLFPTASGYYPVNPPLTSGAFGIEEIPKPRGTGTYFPNTNHHSYRALGRGRNSAATAHNQLPRPRNGRVSTPSDLMSLPDKGSHELQPHAPAAQLQVFGVHSRGKSSSTDVIPSICTDGRGFHHTNGCALPTERLEFGSFGPVQLASTASSEQGRQLDSGALLHNHRSGSMLPMSAMPRPRPNLNQERAAQSYHLKDEDDFPPLSV